MATTMNSGLNLHCCMLATGCERSQMRPQTDWITEWCGVPCSIGGGLPSVPSLELVRIGATGLGRTQSPALGAAATPRRCCAACAVSDETGQISTIHLVMLAVRHHHRRSSAGAHMSSRADQRLPFAQSRGATGLGLGLGLGLLVTSVTRRDTSSTVGVSNSTRHGRTQVPGTDPSQFTLVI